MSKAVNQYAIRKANLLRLELLDLITYDPQYSGEQDDGRVDEQGAMHAAVNWVFRHTEEEYRARLYTALIEGPWTEQRFVEVLVRGV